MDQRWIRLAALPLIVVLAACADTADPQETVVSVAPDVFVPSPAFPLLSFDDRDAIGRVTYAEAGNQGEEGIAAVVFTILNRVNSGQFGADVQEVVDAPNQFEPATRAGGWRYLPPLNSWRSAEFELLLDRILSGQLPDPTGGALFFQNTRIVAARATRGAGSSDLVDFGGTPPIAEIGDHRFYDWRAAINLAARRQPAYATSAVYSTEHTGHDVGSDEPVAVEPEAEDAFAEASPEPSWDLQPDGSPEIAVSEAPDAAECSFGTDC